MLSPPLLSASTSVSGENEVLGVGTYVVEADAVATLGTAGDCPLRSADGGVISGEEHSGHKNRLGSLETRTYLGKSWQQASSRVPRRVTH